MKKPYIEEIEIKLVKIRQMPKHNIHEELIWFANSLGLVNKRDKDKSCYRLFIELVKAAKNKELLSSDDLAARLNLTRATVIHHLKNLNRMGIVKHIDGRYILTSDSLIELMRDIDNNYRRTMKQIYAIAKAIDDELEL